MSDRGKMVGAVIGITLMLAIGVLLVMIVIAALWRVFIWIAP